MTPTEFHQVDSADKVQWNMNPYCLLESIDQWIIEGRPCSILFI